jgi:hypothetical protein
MVILVGGKAGEGKTTFANYCIEYLESVGKSAVIVPFAKGVKDTARFMGWNGEKDDKGRRLLQLVGFAGREYNEDIWAEMALDTINREWLEVDYIFIDDWRFPNEERFMREYVDPVMTVRIKRPKKDHILLGTELYNDTSETSLDHYKKEDYDKIIMNFGDLDDLDELSKFFIDKDLRR